MNSARLPNGSASTDVEYRDPTALSLKRLMPERYSGDLYRAIPGPVPRLVGRLPRELASAGKATAG